MRMPLNIFRKSFTRKDDSPWEVVGRYEIAPVPTFDDDDEDGDVGILHVDTVDSTTVLELDVNNVPDIRKSVIAARRQLLQQVSKQGSNALIEEGWQLTILRNAGRHRVVVQYNGRPARLEGSLPSQLPPFIEMIPRLPVQLP